MTYLKHFLYGGTFALCALLLPDAALAQQQANGTQQASGPRTTGQLVIDVDRSDRMYREAFRLEADNRNWTRAAERYVESARLRPYGDLKAYVALNRAGIIFVHTGDERAARRAFAAAGVRALETGQVYEAAMAFASAAELAGQDRRDGRLVLDYARMAHRLSEAPSLSEEQRQRIRDRMGAGGS